MMGFERHSVHVKGLWMWFVIGGGVFAMVLTGWAKEIAFEAHDDKNQEAVWLPTEIVIHRSTDFTEPLIFRLDNPTARTHIFEAPGLFEFVEEDSVQPARPVRITIPPEGTEQVVVDRDRMSSEAIAAKGEMVTYRFYCPLHRADNDMGGTITVGQ